jgi:hypothetical protein
MTNQFVYFIDDAKKKEFRDLIDALEIAGFERTAEKFEEIYCELHANQVSVDALTHSH